MVYLWYNAHMDYMTFFKSIKAGSLKGAYALHGEEEFVKESALKSLTSSLDETTRDLNLQVLEKADADELISACETLPFFGERRIVICKALPADSDAKKLLAYMPNMPGYTLLIFFIRGKANEKLGIVKALKAENRLVDFVPFRDYEAARWVYQQGKRLNVTITEAAAKHIVGLAGTDIATLNNELTKAADYVGRGNELTREAISACVTRSLEVRIFDMQDYLLSGKAQDGIRAYRQMLSDGESTFGIAGFMEKCFRSMLAARTYIDQGLNRERVLRLTGDKYPQKKAYEAALRYSRAEIIKNMRNFANIAYLKIAEQQPDTLTLENALIECMPKRR